MPVGKFSGTKQLHGRAAGCTDNKILHKDKHNYDHGSVSFLKKNPNYDSSMVLIMHGAVPE